MVLKIDTTEAKQSIDDLIKQADELILKLEEAKKAVEELKLFLK